MSSDRVLEAAMVLLCDVCGSPVRETVIFGDYIVLDHVASAHFPLFLANSPALGSRLTENQNTISQDVKKRKWGWIGHTLHKPTDNITRQALDWNPQGKRKVGRPKQTWRRSVESEAKTTGLSWAQLKKTAQNRVRWRSVVAALCST